MMQLNFTGWSLRTYFYRLNTDSPLNSKPNLRLEMALFVFYSLFLVKVL